VTGGFKGRFGGLAWAAAGAALVAVLLEALCLWQSSYWLGVGDRALAGGAKREALDAWRAAASWSAPWNPWRDAARERLAVRPEPEAQERLRGSILASSMVLTGGERRMLEAASIRLAAGRPDLPPTLWTDVDPKFSWWKVLVVLSLLLFVGSGCAAVKKAAGPSPAGTSRLLELLALQWLGLALVFLGLLLAP
jgi:hypothetical protein